MTSPRNAGEWLLTNPLLWIAILVGVAVGFITDSWIIGTLVAIVAGGSVVAASVSSPRFARLRAAARAEGERQALEKQITEATAGLHRDAAVRIQCTMRLRKQLMAQIASPRADPAIRGFLDSLGAQIDQLTDRTVRLAQRQHLVCTFLDQADEPVVRAKLKSLDAQLRSGAEENRPTLEAALAARERELEGIARMRRATGQMEAQWEQIEAALSELKGRIVTFQATDQVERALARQTVSQEIDVLSKQVSALEQSVEEILVNQQ